ncbi:MAG: ThiF family adenylyltransferase, partial [Planctomycetota bacterium]
DRPLRLVMLDGDSFEDSNAARQLFAYAGNKAQVLREELLDRFAGSKLTIDAIEEYVTPDNVEQLIREGDIVLAALDNHKSRLLLNERCRHLQDVTFISGGNDGVGTEEGVGGGDGPQRGTLGSIQVYLRRSGADITPPLTHYHPEIAKPADRRPDEIDCIEALQSQPQLLFTNMMTATCILNTLMLHVCGDALHYSELSFDVADGLMRPVVAISRSSSACTP